MQNKIGLKDENGKFYFGWYVVIMGFILMIFGYACIVSVSGVFTLPVTTDLGLQIGDFVVWMTIQSLASIIVLLLVQKRMTENMIKPIMIISAICGAVGMFGFSRSTELWHFYLFAIPLGICMSGLTSTPCTVLVTNWFGAKARGVALSLVFGGTSLGCMAIMPILNQTVLNLGWRTAYLSIAIALIVICVPLVLAFAKWSPESKGIARMGDGAESEASVLLEQDKPGIPFRIGIRKVSTWMMFLSGSLLVVASVNVLLHTQTFLVMNGYSPTFGGNIVSVSIGLLFVGSIAIGAVCDKGHLRAGAILTAILFALAFIGQLLIPQLGIAGIGILIIGYGFGCPAVNVISPLLVNHMFGEKDTGRYISYVNMFISLGGAFGATIIGMVLNATGTYTVPFIVCAAFIVICGLIRGTVTSNAFKFQERKEDK
ncbi:MAG: MFS transporter [Firmicutes bacterium]|jgi:MFS family permease|nr:MFS transporter [Bacillota bacterium]NBI62372.1 MFS transporter [Clostridiales bacterium]